MIIKINHAIVAAELDKKWAEQSFLNLIFELKNRILIGKVFQSTQPKYKIQRLVNDLEHLWGTRLILFLVSFP